MWGELWSQMIWGGGGALAGTPIPMPGWALVALGVLMGVVGSFLVRRRGLRLVSLSLLALLPVLALALSLPHTFVNNTVANADEVNANFAALAAQLTRSNIYLRTETNDACGAGVGCVATAFCDDADDIALGGACANGCATPACSHATALEYSGVGEDFNTFRYECIYRTEVGAPPSQPRADVYCLSVSGDP